MRLAGYRIHGQDLGSSGEAYTYVMSGSGLFLETQNSLISARVHLAFAKVRGLPPLSPEMKLLHGPLPGRLLETALHIMTTAPDLELYIALVWDGERYRLLLPPQELAPGHVSFVPVQNTVVGIHSHGRMRAFFSSTDDADEQGFQLSVVVSHPDEARVEVRARLCVYGYFSPVALGDIFDSLPAGLEEV